VYEGDLLRMQWRLSLGGGSSFTQWTAAEVKYDCSVITKPQEDWPTDGTDWRESRGKLMTDLLNTTTCRLLKIATRNTVKCQIQNIAIIAM
jgi:hypothetical protein